MKTISENDLRETHARYAAKGAADPLKDCLAAACEGRLYEVDTHGAGCDSLLVADSDDEAIAEVAAADGREPGTEGAAAVARWTAERVEIEWAMISLDNGRTHTAVSGLTEEQAKHAESALPHDADLYAAAEGDGPMTSWLSRYALACHRTHGHWPVIG